MTLKDSMAADVAAVFHDTSEFASPARFYPAGNGASFACTLLVSDPDQEFVAVDTGVAKTRKAVALGLRSVLRTGITVIEGAERSPRRGDVIVIATDAYAGSWAIETSEDDIGGGVSMHLALDTRWAAAGREARKL